MARLSRVCELERLDAVLEDVREREKTAFIAVDVADVLDVGAVVFEPEDSL